MSPESRVLMQFANVTDADLIYLTLSIYPTSGGLTITESRMGTSDVARLEMPMVRLRGLVRSPVSTARGSHMSYWWRKDAWTFFETKHLAFDMRYHWTKINIFTRWLSSTNQTGILIFDVNDHFPRPLLELEPTTSYLTDPLWAYVKVLKEVSRLQGSAVWAIRNKIRAIETEKMPSLPEGRPQPDYRRLHDIARHAVHVTETLDVAIQNLQHILNNHTRHMSKTFPNLLGKRQDPDIWQDIHAELTSCLSYLDNLKLRSISNEKRLQNEIQLAFNTVAQHDAAITVEISRAMRLDSATITTLAWVTLTFLPPTFICAVFSMSFFDYSPDSGWSVSGKIWIYWAFAIPTVIGTALLWNYWGKIFPGSADKKPIKTVDIPLRDRAWAILVLLLVGRGRFLLAGRHQRAGTVGVNLAPAQPRIALIYILRTT